MEETAVNNSRFIVEVLSLLALSVASSWAAQGDSRSQASLRGVCYPPAFGGIVTGYTEDRDVIAMYGKGLFTDNLGHLGGRYYTNPSRTITLIVEIGVDRIIESVEVKNGLFPPAGKSPSAIPVSQRLQPLDGFGKWHQLHLGATFEEVRENLGPPQAFGERGKDSDLWVYQTDYAPTECYAAAAVSIRFSSGKVVSVNFYNGE